MTDDTKKQLNLYKFLGANLLSQGEWFLAKAHNVKITQKIDRKTLINFLNDLGLKTVVGADNKYFLTSWEVWKSLFHYDWIDQKKYLVDARDCDNFAKAFSARMSIIYGLNTAGEAKNIDVLDSKTEKHLFYHRANLIVATSNGILQAYAFEPQTDEYVLVKKNQPTIFESRNWLFKWGYFEFA